MTDKKTVKGERQPYHAYWLTSSDSQITTEYIPLLLTRRPIDEVDFAQSVRSSGKPRKDLLEADVLIITTYRKDSIWNADGQPVKIATMIESLDSENRIVQFKATVSGVSSRYRYDEAAPKEVIQLLKNPEGTIPIHRTHLPEAGSKGIFSDLIRLFR